MLNIRSYVSVIPRIVRANSVTEIKIVPKHSFIEFSGRYCISVLPKYFYHSSDRVAQYDVFTVEARNNCIEFSFPFGDEQEYYIQVSAEGENCRKTMAIQTSIYALSNDLYSLKVIKGELHQHTIYSDGIESPEHRIAVARKHGMDYIAITDHNSYDGSLRAINVMSRCPNNMVALRGEEVHADFCPVHILSLGAKTAIAPLVTNRSCEQKEQLGIVMERYKETLDDNVDIRSFASAIDVFEKIREAGGLSVLCHIYWDAINFDNKTRMGAPEQLINALVKCCKFDAFEITSGAPPTDTKANYLQETYYREMLPRNFPIIGITDSHSTDRHMGTIFGTNYTIAFVSEFSEKGIIDAIRDYKTVSVDAVTGEIKCHGSLRLCKYAAFLIEEYFPMHDEIVSIEGLYMERLLLAKETSFGQLDALCKSSSSILMDEWKEILPMKNNKQLEMEVPNERNQ